MIFLYFSAYLTGIGALLERLNPPAPDVTTPLIADGFNATNFTLAADATIETAFDSVSVDDFDNGWWWILLFFYALLPVAGCAYVGVALPNFRDLAYVLSPDDPIKYAEWLEKKIQGWNRRLPLLNHRTVRKEVLLVRDPIDGTWHMRLCLYLAT